MNELFNGMLGKIAPGMCRLSMEGAIAIKTSTGYKTYDAASGRLVNCSSFVFNIGEEFFFVIPTSRVKRGDIILVNGRPRCVMEAENNRITAINYEDSTVEQILPERYMFMGNSYLYGKIVSMFGADLKKGNDKILKYMMLSEMMKGTGTPAGRGMNTGGMSGMLPLLLMGRGGEGLLDGIFDFAEPDGDDVMENSV